MKVVKDLVPDLSQANAHMPRSSRGSSPVARPAGPGTSSEPGEREKLNGLYECILCFCCTTSCPSYW